MGKTPTEVTVAIDGGFVRLQPAADIRNFEILTGRIACPGEKPYVFAGVRSEGGSMQERLTALTRAKTAAPAPEVTVITDGGNGVQHLHRLLPGKVRSILDWFHVSIRVRYLEQIVAGQQACNESELYTKRILAELVSKLRWSPRGAHLLVQVRCAVVNGDLASRLRRWSPPPQAATIPAALM